MKSKVKVPRRSLRYGTHRLMVMHPYTNIIDLSRKTKMLWPGQENTIQKTIIWPWGQRSRSHEGYYGMRHTTLWSCTHIPNIIDLHLYLERQKRYGPDKLRWEEAEEAEEKIRLKQYVSLCSKGRHKYTFKNGFQKKNCLSNWLYWLTTLPDYSGAPGG